MYAHVVLPREIRSRAVGEIRERAVWSAELPEHGARGGNGGDGVHVARGDVIITGGVFVDAVDVEVVEGIARAVAVLTYWC